MPGARAGLPWLPAASACLLSVEACALLAGVAARGLPVNRLAACVWRSRLTGAPGVATGDLAAFAAGVLAAGVDVTGALT